MKQFYYPVVIAFAFCAMSAQAKDVGPHGFGKQNPDVLKREKRDNAINAKQISGDIEVYLRWHRDAATLRGWGDLPDSSANSNLPATQL
ncbi:MAG: hypothetical protein ABIP64_00270 [Burkholderiales bacterium]